MALYANTSGPTTIRNAFITLAAKSGAVRLAAPFFSYSRILDEIAAEGRSTYLIVRLGPATSPSELARAFSLPNVHIRYFTSGLFHTKLYIFGDSGALVGSANLTQAGLQSNREAAVTVYPDAPEFEELVSLFEAYWSEAEVLDADRLKEYSRVCANWPAPVGDRQLEDAIKKAFGDSAPTAGIQVGRPRPAASKLYLEDYRRTYQVFLTAYRELEAVYAASGQRKEPSLPLRIEIDQFFNYVRQAHCHGDDYLQAPLLQAPERRAKVEQLMGAWFATPFPYLHGHVVSAYKSINAGLGDAAAIRTADADAILDAMEACHAFTEELRFHSGGLPTLRAEFKQLNEIGRLRQSLEYLLHGGGNFIDRMGTLVFDPARRLAKCGRSVVQELLGWVNGEDIPICNGRTLKVLRFLGYDVRA